MHLKNKIDENVARATVVKHINGEVPNTNELVGKNVRAKSKAIANQASRPCLL
jgi:hypothetical protein